MDSALHMRNEILSAKECSFQAEITADYGDEVQSFTLNCKTDLQGNLTFSVVAPEIISGLTGKIDETGGGINFDQSMLAFPLLADGQLSPVSAPWIFMHSLRSGFIHACGQDKDLYRVTIHDSFSGAPLQMELWFDNERKPVHCEIIWDGRRIITVNVSNFITL